MSKNHRLDIIVKTLCDSDQPVSGTKLAKICDVSRQVIVQDIALLRLKISISFLPVKDILS